MSELSAGPPPKKTARAARASGAARGSSRIARISREATIPRRRGRFAHKSITAPSYPRIPRAASEAARAGDDRRRRPRRRRRARVAGECRHPLLEGAPERLVRRQDRPHLRGALLSGRAAPSAGRRADLLERARRHPARAAERRRTREEGGQEGRARTASCRRRRRSRGTGKTVTEDGTTGATTTGSTTTTATAPGRKPDKGLGGVAEQLNPSSASSLPLPLLVLGGLAILLVAAGGAGLLAKRMQARKQAP